MPADQPGNITTSLSVVMVEREHGRAATTSLTVAPYGPLNVHPGTFAAPAPPGIFID